MKKKREITTSTYSEQTTDFSKQGIGDVTTDTRGTGARFNRGKPPLELIPLEALEQVARVLDYGRKKYASWNWAKGQSWMANLGCALRHLSAFQRGEDIDPESGESHLAHAACCILFALHFERHCRDMDDRPAQLRESYHTLAGQADTVDRVRRTDAEVQSGNDTTSDDGGRECDQAHDAGGVHVGDAGLLQPVAVCRSCGGDLMTDTFYHWCIDCMERPHEY